LRDALLVTALLGLLLLIAARLNRDTDLDVGGPFHVIDGDTLSASGERLRLLGIDAPELDQSCQDGEGRDWRCGLAARKALAQLANGGRLQCKGSARDRYSRLLVTCSRQKPEDRQSINGELVRQGMAVSSGAYHMEETEARMAKRGIWAGTFETPRQWRVDESGLSRPNPLGAIWDWLKTKLDWNGR
jgi:endonuclease YncB( thermonuclease family)